MTDVVQQRREQLVTELGTVEQTAQRAQAVLQQAVLQAERLRGGIALCDELLAEPPAGKPAARQK